MNRDKGGNSISVKKIGVLFLCGSEGKRMTLLKEASATSTRPTAAGMCTNP